LSWKLRGNSSSQSFMSPGDTLNHENMGTHRRGRRERRDFFPYCSLSDLCVLRGEIENFSEQRSYPGETCGHGGWGCRPTNMGLEELISNYGYVVILIGTFLEGETVLVLGGFLAHRGYLELPWVVAAAFAGTVAGDQLFFLIGRRKGMAFLDRHKAWKSKAGRILALLHTHQTWVILARFFY